MNPIVKLAANALPDERKYVLFAGAGISKDAGIPSAWDIMLRIARLVYIAEEGDTEGNISDARIEEWFLASEFSQMSYSELIGELYPQSTSQQDFLCQHLEGHGVGDAHRDIAMLAKLGVIRAIITTNFDQYIEEALHEEELPVQVISTDEDLQSSDSLIHCSSVRIYKPHGDLGKGMLRNTPSDLERLSQPMEDELAQVLSDHGVIVIGYGGKDPGIQRVIARRKGLRYAMFWVDPKPPRDEDLEAMGRPEMTYISCEGAHDFFNAYMSVFERLDTLVPMGRSGPSLQQLEQALRGRREPAEVLYGEYMEQLYKDMETLRPDFGRFDNKDEAFLDQIEKGEPITTEAVGAYLLAARYDHRGAIQKCFDFFSVGLKLTELPRSVDSPYQESDFDGSRYLLRELVVSLVAALLKYERWEAIGEVIKTKLLFPSRFGDKVVPIADLGDVNQWLEDRNRRLKLGKVSLLADTIKEHFENGRLKLQLSYEEVAEADFLLFLKTICTYSDDDLREYWRPATSLYAENPMRFLDRCRSRIYLDKISYSFGFTSSSVFRDRLQSRYQMLPKIVPWIRQFGKINQDYLDSLGMIP